MYGEILVISLKDLKVQSDWRVAFGYQRVEELHI